MEAETKALADLSGPLWPQEEEVIAEQVDLIEGMLDHYITWVTQDRGLWTDDNLEFIAMETEFKVPIRTPTGRVSTKVLLAGRFDGLVKRKDNGTFWLWETKTTRSIDQLTRTLDNDMQAGVYVWAAQEIFGEKIQGVLYNIMRKKVPTPPRALNNGMLSQDKRIDTTLFGYWDAIKSNHPGWTTVTEEGEIVFTEEGKEISLYEYGDMLRHLKDKGNKFFARVPIRRTPAELDTLMEDIHYISLEMTNPNVRIYANPAWNTCTFCSFRAPCLALNAGADYESILNIEYRPRRIWDTLEATESGGNNENS
jgi:hypothetical protein